MKGAPTSLSAVRGYPARIILNTGRECRRTAGRDACARRRDSMPQTPHVERHFTAGESVRDVVIGMSDGLTVPFALAAGLSGAVDSSTIVITAGLAEIAAGSIAMGLGGYLAARSDAEHYESEWQRERAEVRDVPAVETQEVADILTAY